MKLIACVTAQLNIAESILALRIKSLDDALAKAIQQMLTMQLKFAVLVRALASSSRACLRWSRCWS